MHITIIPKNCDGLAGNDPPAIDIGTHSTGHHNPGAVIVGKSNRALQSTGAEDRTLGHDAPKTLQRFARHARPRNTLKRAIGALIVGPRHRRAGHTADIGHRIKCGQNLGHPILRGRAIHLLLLAQQPPAHRGIFICNDHIGTRLPRSQRRHQPRRPRANHQHIAKGKGLFIGVGVCLAAECTKPRRTPDHRLIELFPKTARPHEGLVIKARCQERRYKIIHRHHVIAQRRPSVLARHLQPLRYLKRGCPHVGFRLRTSAHSDQRVLFL